jgi:hypothetical protein
MARRHANKDPCTFAAKRNFFRGERSIYRTRSLTRNGTIYEFPVSLLYVRTLSPAVLHHPNRQVHG